jgi:hypothetical protein
MTPSAVETAETRPIVRATLRQKSDGKKPALPRVLATSAVTAANTSCRNTVMTNTHTPITSARTRKTRTRLGSHVRSVCIVLLVQSAPPSDAPSSTARRITNVAVPCRIVSRSRRSTASNCGDQVRSQ